MDKITNLEKVIIQSHSLKELNLNMTNILVQLSSTSQFFDAIERNLTIRKLKVAAIC